MDSSVDVLHWVLLGLIALLGISLLIVIRDHQDLAERVSARERSSPSPSELRAAVADLAELGDETRRAHVRLDNQNRQLQALIRELGWSDDRHRTEQLGSPPSSFKLGPNE